jgi:hypothetical protein
VSRFVGLAQQCLIERYMNRLHMRSLGNLLSTIHSQSKHARVDGVPRDRSGRASVVDYQ